MHKACSARLVFFRPVSVHEGHVSLLEREDRVLVHVRCERGKSYSFNHDDDRRIAKRKVCNIECQYPQDGSMARIPARADTRSLQISVWNIHLTREATHLRCTRNKIYPPGFIRRGGRAIMWDRHPRLSTLHSRGRPCHMSIVVKSVPFDRLTSAAGPHSLYHSPSPSDDFMDC